MDDRAREWADEIFTLLKACGGGSARRLAVDRLDPPGTAALADLGVELEQGQAVLEYCRARKSPDELAAMRRAIEVCEASVAALQSALRPGASENQVWAQMNAFNLANDGEWSETRLFASGPRTNPWFQECSPRPLEAGDVASLDTDLVGPYGMCTDMSRSFATPGAPPLEEARVCHGLALAQIRHNTELLRPGVTGAELAEQGFQLPEKYLPNRYSCIIHGIGMADEWPHVAYREDALREGSDVVLEEGMTVCVESYAGADGGRVGIKLEEQVFIGEKGPILLTSYPYDPALLGRPWV